MLRLKLHKDKLFEVPFFRAAEDMLTAQQQGIPLSSIQKTTCSSQSLGGTRISDLFAIWILSEKEPVRGSLSVTEERIDLCDIPASSGEAIEAA